MRASLFVIALFVLGAFATTCQESVTTLESQLKACVPTDVLTDLLSSQLTLAQLQTGLISSSCDASALQSTAQQTLALCSVSSSSLTTELLATLREVSLFQTLVSALSGEEECLESAKSIYASVISGSFNATTSCMAISSTCVATLRSAIMARIPLASVPAIITQFVDAIAQCRWSNGLPCFSEVPKLLNVLKAGDYVSALNTVCSSQCVRLLPVATSTTVQTLLSVPCTKDSASGQLCIVKISNLLKSTGLSACVSAPMSCPGVLSKVSQFVAGAGDCLSIVSDLGDAVPSMMGSLLSQLTAGSSSSSSVATKLANITLTLKHLDLTAIQANSAAFIASLADDIRAAAGLSEQAKVVIQLLSSYSGLVGLRRSTTGSVKVLVSAEVTDGAEYSNVMSDLSSSSTLVLTKVNANSAFAASPLTPVTSSLATTTQATTVNSCSSALTELQTLKDNACFQSVFNDIFITQTINPVTVATMCSASTSTDCNFPYIKTVLSAVSTYCNVTGMLTSSNKALVRNMMFNTHLLCDSTTAESQCFAVAAKAVTMMMSNTLNASFVPVLCQSTCLKTVLRVMSAFGTIVINTPAAKLVDALGKVCLKSGNEYCYNTALKALKAFEERNVTVFADAACSNVCLRRYSVYAATFNTTADLPYLPCYLSAAGQNCYKVAGAHAVANNLLVNCADLVSDAGRTNCAIAIGQFGQQAGDCGRALYDILDADTATKIKGNSILSSFIQAFSTQTTTNMTYTINLANVNVAAIKLNWVDFKNKLAEDLRLFLGVESTVDISITVLKWPEVPATTPILARDVTSTTAAASTTTTTTLYVTFSAVVLSDHAKQIKADLDASYDGSLTLYNVNSEATYSADVTVAPAASTVYEGAVEQPTTQDTSASAILVISTFFIAFLAALVALL